MNRNDEELVAQLVGIAGQGAPAIPPMLEDAERAWAWLHEGGPRRWTDLASNLPEMQLELLIRGLVLYSRTGRPLGGSVSPAIFLFREFARRFPEPEAQLARWVVANRVNDYEPFGTTLCNDAPSMAEHQTRRLERDARRHLELQTREQEARAEKQQRDAEKATARLGNAVRRGDSKAVDALLRKGGDPTKALADGGSLIDLALKNDRLEVAELLRSRGIR